MDKQILNERLTELLKYDVRSILGNDALKKEYIELHFLIEGHRPSCTGCSAKSSLRKWAKKYSKNDAKLKVAVKKTQMTDNTFKFKKGVKNLRIPFTSKVITESSSDELVNFYINQVDTETEKERRKAFFETLPSEPKKKRKKRVKKEVEQVIEDNTSIEEIQFKEVD